MGGAVSSGYDNDSLIDNLRDAEYIRTSTVERAFRTVDRAEYFLPQARYTAYKDLAWKNGHFHLSAPCIYSGVMERLCLEPGLSFLNLGSGTGYLSTMVGLILGSRGINHGIEIYEDVIEYANKKLEDFKKYSGAIDEYDFCEPKFKQGNCLCLTSDQQYDRVYCGAACPEVFMSYMKNLLRINGILVIPLNDQLLQIKRTSEASWEVNAILPVSFSTLIMPVKGKHESVELFDIEPENLQSLCRSKIRNILRTVIDKQYPHFKTKSRCSKRSKNRDKDNLSLSNISTAQLGLSNRRYDNVNILDIVMDHFVYVHRRANEGDRIEPNENRGDEINDQRPNFFSSNSESEAEYLSEAEQNAGNIDAGTVNAIEGFVVNVLQGMEDFHRDGEDRSNNPEQEERRTSTSEAEVNSNLKKNGGDVPANGESASSSQGNQASERATNCEKFDSGLGEDIIEKDTSISSESSDHEQMDLDSGSSSSSNDGQNKRQKRLSKQSKLRSKCRRFRTNLRRLYSFTSSDSDEMEEEEAAEEAAAAMETDDPIVVASPYTAHMQDKIQELPLPTILKKYLNYYRDF